MTRIVEREAPCAWCSTPQTYWLLASTNSFGATDVGLDGRPGGMARRAVARAVTQCAQCGFCAPDLARRLGDWDHRGDDAYAAILADASIVPVARSWLAQSRIQEKDGAIEPAAGSALVAAWVGDDEGSAATSERGRTTCARLLASLAARSPSTTLRLVDVYRVLGRTDEASAHLDGVAGSGALTPMHGRIVAAQRRLLADGDRRPMAITPDG